MSSLQDRKLTDCHKRSDESNPGHRPTTASDGARAYAPDTRSVTQENMQLQADLAAARARACAAQQQLQEALEAQQQKQRTVLEALHRQASELQQDLAI